MNYDVIIIGGGPAGSTFARLMSKSNHKIALINGQNAKNRKPCGGLLAPDAQKALANYNMVLPKRILVDPQIFSVETIDLKYELIRHYSRCYLNVDRYLFDEWLLSLVPSNVKIYNTFCTKVVKENNYYLVSITDKNKTVQLKTKYLIGADGASSIVRNTFFKNKIKKYVAIQEWYKLNNEIKPFYSCVFDPLTSKSCSWSLCKNDYLIFGGAFDTQSGNKNFEIQKSRFERLLNIKFGKVVKREACLVSRPRKIWDFKIGKDNVFLLGEAAGFISPSSFEGISFALNSAKYLNESFKHKNISLFYKLKTLKIVFILVLKMLKRWFMYTPIIRLLIMKSRINSIKVQIDNE